jgi:hypothetical protein
MWTNRGDLPQLGQDPATDVDYVGIRPTNKRPAASARLRNLQQEIRGLLELRFRSTYWSCVTLRRSPR